MGIVGRRTSVVLAPTSVANMETPYALQKKGQVHFFRVRHVGSAQRSVVRFSWDSGTVIANTCRFRTP